MANRYWVGGTANWDNTAGSKWSTSSGGSGGASAPGSSDDVFFDSHSSGTITVTDAIVIKSLSFSGFTGTLAGSGEIVDIVTGNLTFGSGGTYNFTGTFRFKSNGTSHVITSNSAAVACIFSIGGTTSGPSVSLGDALNTSGYLIFENTWSFTASNHNVTTGQLVDDSSSSGSLTLGSGTWTISGSNISPYNATWKIFNSTTITAGTATIKFTKTSGTKTFSDTGNNTYPTIEDVGAGTLVFGAGGCTIGTFTADPGTTTQFPGGKTVTFNNFSAAGTSGSPIVLSRSGSGVATLSKASGTVSVSHCTISNSTATGGATWQALTSNGNVDGGSNTGWDFGSQSVTPGAGNLALTRYAPRLGRGLRPGLGSLTLAGYAPLLGKGIRPGVRALTLAGYAPELGPTFIPGTHALSLGTYAPTVGSNLTITPNTGSLTLSQYAAILDLGLHPGAGGLVLESYVPSLTGNDITVGAGRLGLSPYAPFLGRGFVPNTAILALTGYAPERQIDLDLVPGVGTLALTTYAAILDTNISPSTGVLILTTYSPHVTPQNLPPPIYYIPAENRTVSWPGNPT